MNWHRTVISIQSLFPEHLASSKKVLESIADTPVKGYRMARMMPVDEKGDTKSRL
jgi:hypothetical protein